MFSTESVLDPSLDESFEEFMIENDVGGGSEIALIDNDKDALHMYIDLECNNYSNKNNTSHR